MVQRLILFAFLFIHTLCVSGAIATDSTTVYGKAPSYAGLRLKIESQGNPILRTNSTLASIQVANDGSFTSTFYLPETLKILIRLGEADGTLVLQPGGRYLVELPPYSALTEANRLNPFYIAPTFALAIVDGDKGGLNRMVGQFDDEFNTTYLNQVHKLFKKESEKPLLPIIAYFDSAYKSDNKWFNDYKHFTYHQLYDLAFQRRKEFIASRFFKESTFQSNNPAFIRAFNASFYRYLSVKMASSNSDSLKQAWRSRSIDSISRALAINTILINDTLREAVILKNLYDAFYSDLYDKEEILMLIEQSTIHFKTEINLKWATEIVHSLKKLSVGSEAPDFSLTNENGKSRSLKKYRGKFVYLNFMDTKNYACKKDLLSLPTIQAITRKELEIVTILTDSDFNKAKEFIKSNKLDWEFLSIKNQVSLLSDYKISVLPSYFVINPEGQLLISPALGPEENFLAQFQEHAKAYKNKELRKNPPKQKSIFDL